MEFLLNTPNQPQMKYDKLKASVTREWDLYKVNKSAQMEYQTLKSSDIFHERNKIKYIINK